MIANEDWYKGEQVIGTRVEKTPIGYAIFIDLQEKSIKLEFRDDGAFDFVNELVKQAEEVKTSKES